MIQEGSEVKLFPVENTMARLIHKIRQLLYDKSEKRHALVGQPKLWKMKRQFQLQFLTSVGLEPSHRLLEIGCGTLRGGIPIIDYLEKRHYWGIESRENVLEEAKKEIKDSNLEGKEPFLILPEGMTSQSAALQFDVIWAFSVLIHMVDQIIEDNFKMISKHLFPSGVFYANVNIGTRPPGNWQGFPVMWRSLDFFNNLSSNYNLIMEDMGKLENFGHISGIADQDEQRMLKFSKRKA